MAKKFSCRTRKVLSLSVLGGLGLLILRGNAPLGVGLMVVGIVLFLLPCGPNKSSSSPAENIGGSSASYTGNPACAVAPGPGAPPAGPILDFFNCVNSKRSSALAWNPLYAGVAQQHADDMVTASFFGLVNPLNGCDMPTRAVSSGATWPTWNGQGIAAGFSSGPSLCAFLPPTSVVFDARFTKIGIGYNPGAVSPFGPGTWAYFLTD